MKFPIQLQELPGDGDNRKFQLLRTIDHMQEVAYSTYERELEALDSEEREARKRVDEAHDKDIESLYNEIDEKISEHAKNLGDIADSYKNMRNSAETRLNDIEKYAEELRTCENKRDYFEINGVSDDLGEPGLETCKGFALFKEGESCNQSLFPPESVFNLSLQQGYPDIEPSYFSDTLVCPDVDECLEKGNYGDCQDYGYDPKDMKKGLRHDPDFRNIGFGNSNSRGEISYMCPAYIPCFKKEEEEKKDRPDNLEPNKVTVTIYESYGDGLNGTTINVMDKDGIYQSTLGEDFDTKKESDGEQDVARYEVTLNCGKNTFECNPMGSWQSEVSFTVGNSERFQCQAPDPPTRPDPSRFDVYIACDDKPMGEEPPMMEEPTPEEMGEAEPINSPNDGPGETTSTAFLEDYVADGYTSHGFNGKVCIGFTAMDSVGVAPEPSYCKALCDDRGNECDAFSLAAAPDFGLATAVNCFLIKGCQLSEEDQPSGEHFFTKNNLTQEQAPSDIPSDMGEGEPIDSPNDGPAEPMMETTSTTILENYVADGYTSHGLNGKVCIEYTAINSMGVAPEPADCKRLCDDAPDCDAFSLAASNIPEIGISGFNCFLITGCQLSEEDQPWGEHYFTKNNLTQEQAPSDVITGEPSGCESAQNESECSAMEGCADVYNTPYGAMGYCRSLDWLNAKCMEDAPIPPGEDSPMPMEWNKQQKQCVPMNGP